MRNNKSLKLSVIVLSVLDDFTTWDEEKYAFVKEVQENGRFVGLDHAIRLGENGITLSSANGL